jgi:regulator of cell morphogenesis and NO signaling
LNDIFKQEKNMTVTINPASSVGELVIERPIRSRVFERFGIDYCCGGKIPLEEACRRRGVPLEAVVEAIQAEDDQTGGSPRDWSQSSLAELCEHIVTTHHGYLREELPRLSVLMEKVARVHGENHPELIECRRVFLGFVDDLTSHMEKEERILFPMIASMEQTQVAGPFHCGSISSPIRMMEHEHDGAGDAMARMRELTGDYLPPEGACNSYRALLDGLARLEQNMHQHVHKENNILFPRAEALERQLDGSASAG